MRLYKPLLDWRRVMGLYTCRYCSHSHKTLRGHVEHTLSKCATAMLTRPISVAKRTVAVIWS